MGWRHRQGEGRKLGRQARDAVMACFCGADSFTAVPGWVFPESCLNPTLVMTSRPSADELRPADKDDSGIESPGMLYSSSSRSILPELFQTGNEKALSQLLSGDGNRTHSKGFRAGRSKQEGIGYGYLQNQ